MRLCSPERNLAGNAGSASCQWIPVQDKAKTTNQMHAFLLEFGISVPEELPLLADWVPFWGQSFALYLSQLLLKLQQHYHYLVEQIKDSDPSWNESWTKTRLDSACVAFPASEHWQRVLFQLRSATEAYASSRDFAAATGLVPRQHSTGGRTTSLESVSEVIKDPNFVGSVCQGIHRKLEHQSGNWPIGSGIYCAGKQLCRHLCSGKQAGQNSLGRRTTANLCSITAEYTGLKNYWSGFANTDIDDTNGHRPVRNL